MRIGVIIAAAGKSTRFGAGDKLSQDLGGRAVLLRTVEAFTKRDEVATIVVAGPPDDLEGFRSRFGPALGFNGARIVAGGSIERWETIRNALAELPDDLTHIAVHDGARPCIGNELLDRVFAAGVVDDVMAAATDAVAAAAAGGGTVLDLGCGEGSYAAALAARGLPCEIIELKGSVELAVVADLADAIVDLVETGATLRENGLVVLEELFSSTARAVVNRAAFRRRHDEVRAFLALLSSAPPRS